MRLAVLGGSYNPIHIGHLLLADTVCRICGYDTIAFIPAFLSPFKDGHQGCTTEDRVAMVRLAIAENPAFYCECCEVERQGISYTVDTLRFLAQKYPQREGKIGLIIGDDLLAGLDRWHQADQLPVYADIIVGNRINGSIGDPGSIPYMSSLTSGGQPVAQHDTSKEPAAESVRQHTASHAEDAPLAKSGSAHLAPPWLTAGGIPYTRIANALLPVSSSSIRTGITQKKAWRYLVPPAVYSYIIEHNLYE